MAFQDDSIYWVEVEKIVANPFQPRREFDEAKLKELAESIRLYGILQPLTVTRKEVEHKDGSFRNEYELIAGERRLRASKLAGLVQVPVIIRDGEQTEQEKLELAIIENLQREDLNAVDRALAFRQLCDVFGLSHSQVAKKVGRSREYVSNTVRLLNLPDYMLDSLRLGDITEGHARTLLMVNDRPEEQDVVFRETLLKKLSVRELERVVRAVAGDKGRNKPNREGQREIIEFERRFTESLGTRVSITPVGEGGKITIDYFSPDDLEVIFARIKAEAAANQAAAETDSALASIAEATALSAKNENENDNKAEASLAGFLRSSEGAATVEKVVMEKEDFPLEHENVRVPEELEKIDTETPAVDLINTERREPDAGPVTAVVPPRVSSEEFTPVPVEVPDLPKIVDSRVSVSAVPEVSNETSSTIKGSSLKAQLAALLSRKSGGGAAVSAPSTATPAPSISPVTEVKKDDDEDLYSTNNFTI